MRALVFDGGLKLKEYPVPEDRPNEALVKVRLAGICNTDVEICRGYMGFHGVLGHEFVGTVEHAQDRAMVGSRVVGEINVGCGSCHWCSCGMERHCPERTVLGIAGRNGAMAEYLTLPLANLVPVPDSVDDSRAVFVEPIAAALEILEQVSIRPNDRVLVIGDGKLGMLVCMVLQLTGCEVTMVGKHPKKLALAADMGALVLSLDSFSKESRAFDVVVEASGNPSGWALAVDCVKPRGMIVLKSTYHGELRYNPASLVINEVSVVGSRCGRFAPAVRLLERGLIDPSRLISGIFPLERAEEAFEHCADPDCFKILLQM